MKRKILYVVNSLIKTGPTNQLFNIISNIDWQNFEITVVTLTKETPDQRNKDFRDVGARVVPLGAGKLSFWKTLRKLKKVFDLVEPQIVHSQGIRSDIFVSVLNRPVQKITTIRCFPQKDYVFAYGKIVGRVLVAVQLFCLRKFDHVVAVSCSVKNNLIKIGNFKNIITIKNGVAVERYRDKHKVDSFAFRSLLGIPQDAQVFVTVGPLIERKNPIFLIENWLSNHGNGAAGVLLVIGDGPLMAICKQKSVDSTNIIFTGNVDNVENYLQISDFYISVSLGEGMPNAVLEALAADLPVLLSDIEPHREIEAMLPKLVMTFPKTSAPGFLKCLRSLGSAKRDTSNIDSYKVFKKIFSDVVMSENYQRLYAQVIVDAQRNT